MIKIITRQSLEKLFLSKDDKEFYERLFESLSPSLESYILFYSQNDFKDGNENEEKGKGFALVVKKEGKWFLKALLAPYAFESQTLTYRSHHKESRRAFYEEIYGALTNLSMVHGFTDLFLNDLGELWEEVRDYWPSVQLSRTHEVFLPFSDSVYAFYKAQKKIKKAA